MTHTEELAKIAARLAEIAKEMAPQPAPSKICAIGEKKKIGGKWYKKLEENGCCQGCDFDGLACPGWLAECQIPIEDGGSECEGTIWKQCRK